MLVCRQVEWKWMSLTLLCCPMMFQGFSVRATVGLQRGKDFLQKLYTLYSYRKQCVPGRLICQHITAGVRNGNKVTVNVYMPSLFRADIQQGSTPAGQECYVLQALMKKVKTGHPKISREQQFILEEAFKQSFVSYTWVNWNVYVVQCHSNYLYFSQFTANIHWVEQMKQICVHAESRIIYRQFLISPKYTFLA